MLNAHPWLSVIPPLVTVFIAIRFRQIFVAIFTGLWLGTSLIADGNIFKGLIGALERCINVFKDPSQTKVILFCCLIGAIIAFAQRSGGIKGFIELLSRRRLVRTRRQAELLTVAIGSMIPVESSINILVPGTVSRPIYDEFRISREKLAFLCMSFSAPICTLIPANAWGAYVSGVVGALGIPAPYQIYLRSIPWNFYALFTIGFALILILTQKDFFTMAKYEKLAREGKNNIKEGACALMSDETLTCEPKEGVVPRAWNMLLPVVTMIVTMVAAMFITGHGKFTEGSGSTSVFFAVINAIVVTGIKYRISGIMKFNELQDLFLKSVGGLAGMGLLIVLSFSLSTICLDINTGVFVAGMAKSVISIKLVPAVLFILTCFVAFATGTAWGAWAIMVPIGLGFFPEMNMPAMIAMGAMMGGGVFGNHCSPIADTTIMASLASGGDIIDIVKGALPYALSIAGVVTAAYLVLGVLFL